MERKCPKCGEKVPKKLVIDGKHYNLQHRKYCFECSPFGEHNTRKLEIAFEFGKNKPCIDCGRIHEQKGRRCPTCNFNSRKEKVTKLVQSIVGNSCWMCGYDKCWRNLCFHHLSNKLFSLSSREYMLKWERVCLEMQKCVLVCMNCHGEIHQGLIQTDDVRLLHKTFWSNQELSSVVSFWREKSTQPPTSCL